MNRPTLVSSCLVLLILACAAGAAIAQEAEPDVPRRRPAPGARRQGLAGPPPARVVKVADGSITIRAAAPAAGAAKPADPKGDEQTLAIDKERTRVAIGVVMAERMTDTGQRLRTMRLEGGELADLEAGQFVHVTAQDGAATEIQIVPDPDAPLPGPGTVVKVGENSITVAPGAVAAAAPGAAAAPERTYTIDPEKTRVMIESVTAERVTAGGQVARAVSYKSGTAADLKEGQFVQVRARGDVAVQIQVVPTPLERGAPRGKGAAKPAGNP